MVVRLPCSLAEEQTAFLKLSYGLFLTYILLTRDFIDSDVPKFAHLHPTARQIRAFMPLVRKKLAARPSFSVTQLTIKTPKPH
jgi:hypothetical protein